jgi:aspartate 1-decarboxylase
MHLEMCAAKIHRATVTEANLNYIGSVTIDADLLAVTGIRPFQLVQITNCANGALWRTYVIAGPAGRGDICLNGPPARHFAPGDKVIILAEVALEPEELDGFTPTVVFVDDDNRVTEVRRFEEPFATMGSSPQARRGN